ncbi:terminase family protein [Brevundimonas sp.]|uniref:DNA-packaging protein n=1 Tax=Brevundimonas sp. TaxID=1871086 RepID=UPI0025C3DA9E|nr:terminase family protein [Brevundimonas sp.]
MREHLAATWALHKHQISPDFDWRTWVLLGGRGSGKTCAGAAWIADLAKRPNLTLALVGPALHDVREVMIEGPSGVMTLADADSRPHWEGSRKRLVWSNGTVAYAFSAEDADSLRGPQFHAAWADEFCAWRQPERVLSNLRFGLRLGDHPQLLVTTTPRPLPALRRLMTSADAYVERGPTSENSENLSPGFLAHLNDLYGGTSLAAQELEGLVVEADGALFTAADLATARGNRPAQMERIVVGVDPPITTHGDGCGIVVVGRAGRTAYVLADRSRRGLSPNGWARAVVEAAGMYGAHSIVAESNQGGEMVRTILSQAGCETHIRLVHASTGKRSRAEPVAALYEQGRVVHCAAFPQLEEEMMALGSEVGGASPDRADALVWAITDLLIDARPGPRIRCL